MPTPTRRRVPHAGSKLSGRTLVLWGCGGLALLFWTLLHVHATHSQSSSSTAAAGRGTTRATAPGSTARRLGTPDALDAPAAQGAAGSGLMCHTDPNNEYHGDVVKWGASNLQDTAEACCASCAATSGCNMWVWCGAEAGCGYGTAPQHHKECWLKKGPMAHIMDNYGKGHAGIAWTAGSVYSDADLAAWQEERRMALDKEAKRLQALKDDPALPLVWLEVSLRGQVLGRIEMVLFVNESPRAAENMRLLCSGEKGKNARGEVYHLKGSYFYRIIDRFIDQTGAAADGIYDGEFRDDPGGLLLKHSHKGLLSMANGGPNTNGGHFSLIMGPAHHLDGSYTIFGEIVSGIEHAEKINELSKGQKNNELLQSKDAQITDAGQTRKGTVADSPAYRAVVESEYARVAYRSALPQEELRRLAALKNDQDLPLVFFEVELKKKYIGRIEMVLFVRESPLAAENFRALCTGEKGVAPPHHEGAGQPYHFKGIYFYRIIENFIDQTGAHTDSTFFGLFKDDEGGLKLQHTHKGLLSMANIGPNTNGAHFSIIMGAPRHLDTKYTIFGEVVDGLHVIEAINKLAHGEPNGEHSGSQDAQIVDSGELRRGAVAQSVEYKAIIDAELQRVAREWRPPPAAT